jgi:hypothetical protein
MGKSKVKQSVSAVMTTQIDAPRFISLEKNYV